MDLADSTELKHGGRVTVHRLTETRIDVKCMDPLCSTVSLLRIQTEDLISSHDQTCTKRSKNALDSCRGRTGPPATQRRVPDAGGAD